MTPVTDLRFRVEWSSVDDSVRADELRATWARLEIWVGDTCATLAEDSATGSTRRSIVVSLYPLAEWIAYNWWLLRYDGRDSQPQYRTRRRNLRSSGDGFIWPDLEIAPSGTVSLVRWSPARQHPGDTLRYLSSGQRWVDSVQLQHSLADLVQTIMTRLEETDLRDTPLQKEWAALAALDRDEAEFCEAAARLGLDPFSEGIDIAESIAQTFETLHAGLREDFLDAVQSEAIAPALSWVHDSLEEVRRKRSPLKGAFNPELIVKARHDVSQIQSGVAPWAVGYAVARDVRSQLGVGPTECLEELPVRVAVRQGGVREVTGVGSAASSDELVNLVLLRDMWDTAKRFAMSRALWHATTSNVDDGYLLTGARSVNQQIGRAFAAELLAPAAGIRGLLDVDPGAATPEDLGAVAEHFQTSDMVVGHQVENQLLHV